MESSYKVNVYENNQTKLYAVQGEAESRTVKFTVVEKSGIVIPTSNAAVTDQLLDLTGYEAKMTAVYSDGSTSSCSGSVDAENSVISFVLGSDFTVIPGKADCLIILSDSETNLRIAGITLNVQPAVFEHNDINVPKTTTYPITVAVYNRDGSLYQLSGSEVLRFGVKRHASDDGYLIQKDAGLSDRISDGSYHFTIEPADTSGMQAGDYRYGISLITGNNAYPIIKDSLFKLSSAVVSAVNRGE